MYICDSHTHTSYSFDGYNSPDEMCQAAIKAGLNEIAITDHYDIDDIMDGFYSDYDAENAAADIFKAAEKYKSELRVVRGIELGQPMFRKKEAELFVKKNNFDYIIGSIHNLENVPDFCFLKYELMNDTQIESLFSRSLDAITELTDFEGISTIAHITYPHRYVKMAGRDINLKKFHDKFVFLFKKIIEKGIALEVNTSTLRTSDMTMPQTDIVKLYRECGGELVTVGSDAHKPEHIAFGIKETYGVLKDIGFNYVTVFRHKTPEFIKI